VKKPGGLRGFVGLPVVTLAVVGIGLVALYQVYLNHDAWPLGLVAIAIMSWATKAHGEVHEYRQWKAAWDGMAPAAAVSPVPKPAKMFPLMLIVAATAIYLMANLDQPGFRFALAWLLGGAMLLAIVALVRKAMRRAPRAARRTREADANPVAVVVKRPLLPVPDLTNAYGALPPHCLKLLRIGQH